MFFISIIQKIVDAGTTQLLTWLTQLLPQVFLFLIFLNAVTCLIGRARVEKVAAKCGSNPLLRYMVLPFLSAVVLGNPMAISMGRYLPEEYKPAYFASASYHCHTNSGIFQHVNPAELFLWLGIANGVLARGLGVLPLAIRYLAAGLVANFVSGYATELITRRIEKRQGIRLERKVDLWTEQPDASEEAGPEQPDLFGAAEEAERPGNSGAEGSEQPGDPAKSETGQPGGTEVTKQYFGTEDSAGHAGYRSIKIVSGDGGYGGPLTITPTPEKHTVIYLTGGGREPEPLAKILALSGMDAVNMSSESCPEEKVALAIIDCGGTLRCGIYPKKRIPTVNIMATGKSGPLAQYITEDIYVSAVTSAEVFPAEESSAGDNRAAGDKDIASKEAGPMAAENREAGDKSTAAAEDFSAAAHNNSARAAHNNSTHAASRFNLLLEPVVAVSRIISVFQQSAREAVRTCLEMILPFMGFAALFIGICRGSGITQFLAGLMKPMGGSVSGLLALGIICSIPGLSAVLGAGATAAQIFAAVIGDLIATGSIAPYLALPALFAINCQCACDFIPVGLGMTEAKPGTTQVGIAAVTISRFMTSWIRILIAIVFSVGLYAAR